MNMSKLLFNYSDGDFALAISDNMAIDTNGNTIMRMGDNMAIDMDTGEIRLTSSWESGGDDYQ